MCGILGVRRSWRPDRACAQRALAAMAWRGPDGQRLIEIGDWFLGVARLWITDRTADQPLLCPSSGRAIAFNGAVTSAEREARELGAARRTGNDAELVLLRLANGGPAALTATCGPYAFAVVDPAADVLYLARDPEGEKPLFVVTAGDDVVAFASGAAALRALGLDVRLGDDDVARLLRYGFALPPVLRGGGFALHADLRGAYVAGRGRGLVAIAGEAPSEVRSHSPLAARVVAATVRCATAEVPVGLSLSGGVDSSCLAAALRRAGRRLPAYQFAARGEATEERDRAVAVAAAPGLELRCVDGGPEILAALWDLTRATALPQGDPSVLAAHALALAARRDGVKVLLSGEGADDQWLGYRRDRAARWLPRRGLRGLPAPRWGMGAGARLWRALGSRVPYDALLEASPPAFRQRVLALAAHDGALPQFDGAQSALQRARSAERSFYLRHDLLPKCDTALLAAGVEGRCPYLDPEVLASAETNGADARAILGKRALKAAFAGDLPPGILERRKLGFGLPLDRWLRQDQQLVDLLTQQRTLARPHVQRRALSRLVDQQRAGRVRLGHALYLVAALEVYLRVLEESAA